MKKSLFILIGLTLLSNVSYAKKLVSDIEGLWQSYDDVTGKKKGIVKISYNKKTQSYIGKIVKVTPATGYKPKVYCQNCPKPFTNKKIKGLTAVWNLKAEKSSNGSFKGTYDNGYIIDPLSGRIYRFKAQLSRNKKILKGRAYTGLVLMGRSQNWMRIE